MTADAVVSHARAAKPTPLPTYTPKDRRKCTHKCDGGQPCVGDAMHPHVYHLCKDEDCPCKQAMRGNVTYTERPRKQRIALAVTQGNMLDLAALMRHIGGKRVRGGVGRAPYPPRGAQERG